MSEVNLVVPAHLRTEVGVAEGPEPEVPIEERARQLPEPSGYHILCAVPEIEGTYESGLIKADKTIHNEEVLTTVLYVIALGPDCYKDKKKFPTGAWCEKGDFVLIRPHTGSRLIIYGKELRLINDDSVEGTVADPRGISRP